MKKSIARLNTDAMLLIQHFVISSIKDQCLRLYFT